MKIHSCLKRLLRAGASLVAVTALSTTLISASAVAEEMTYDATNWPGGEVKNEVSDEGTSYQVTVSGVNASSDSLYAAYDGYLFSSHDMEGNSATLDGSTLSAVYGAYAHDESGMGYNGYVNQNRNSISLNKLAP